ncbi:MAG: hypothetical protein ABIT20_04615 [Gemmatimonadaceae bacterium]
MALAHEARGCGGMIWVHVDGDATRDVHCLRGRSSQSEGTAGAT